MTAVAPEVDPLGLQAEHIVAVIGVEPFLAHTLRTVTKAHYERAGNVPTSIDTKLYRFMGQEERDVPADLPPFDFEAVAELVTTENTPEGITKNIAAFGPNGDLALAAGTVVTRIKAMLSGRLPHAERQTLAGPVKATPPDSDLARFRRLWNIANTPLMVFDDLLEWAVSRDQAQALADCYPLTFASLAPAVKLQLHRKLTAKPNFELPRRKDLLLRILTKQEDATYILGRAMQEIYAQDAQKRQAQQAKMTAKRAVNAATESTAAQRVDQL
jgi:hypothetical protein